MNKKIILLLLSAVFICTSCINELDNYDAPNGGVYGTIVDEETGEPIPLPVQGSTGVMINLMEVGTDATKSVDFYAKCDGTYQLSTVFNCDYSISINNGPFVSPPAVTTTVKGQTKCDITAKPLSRVQATATVNGKVVTINYTVTPTTGYTVSDVYGYWNFSPGVDDGTANKAATLSSKSLSGTFTFNLANDQQYTKNSYKIAANNNTVYVRVGAKASGKINYSTIIALKLGE